MKQQLLIKLFPEDYQKQILLETVLRVNEATSFASKVAWITKTYSHKKLGKLIYTKLRTTYGLSSQVVVKLLSRVADGYKLKPCDTCIYIQSKSPIPYDNHCLSFQNGYASIWTLSGRIKVQLDTNYDLTDYLKYRQGESWLIYEGRNWYLLTQVNFERLTENLPLATLVSLPMDWEEGNHDKGTSELLFV